MNDIREIEMAKAKRQLGIVLAVAFRLWNMWRWLRGERLIKKVEWNSEIFI